MAKKANTTNTTVTDNDVIDLVTTVLYSDTTKEFAFEEDILQKTKLKYTATDINRVWELLLASNMVDQSIGFGKAGKIELSASGLLIMNKFGSYGEFIKQQLLTEKTIHVENLTPSKPAPVVKSRKSDQKK